MRFAPAVAIVTIAWSLAGCGRAGFAERATPGAPASRVQELFGTPDERYPDPENWVSMLAKAPACQPTDRITSAWRYSPILHDDAMVFFDGSERVVCVEEGGVIFDMRSH